MLIRKTTSLLADIVSKQKRSEMMAGIRDKNTKPEIFVRRLLHRAGFRFRLHSTKLPGRPDLVLSKWQTAIFVHGCFWHGHDNCPLFRLPKSREEFWTSKIKANQARDQKLRLQYNELNWRMLEVWECSIKGRTRLIAADFEEQLLSKIMSTHPYEEIRGGLSWRK